MDKVHCAYEYGDTEASVSICCTFKGECQITVLPDNVTCEDCRSSEEFKQIEAQAALFKEGIPRDLDENQALVELILAMGKWLCQHGK